jgi:hypothetical protein
VSRVRGLSSDMDCLQAIPLASRSAAALDCISLKNGWVCVYAGSQAHVPLFLQVAGALKAKA